MKMTVNNTHPTLPPPHKLNGSLQEPHITIYCPQLNTLWPVTTSRAKTQHVQQQQHQQPVGVILFHRAFLVAYNRSPM